MNSAAYVDNKIREWKTMGLSKAELVVLQAEAMLGWPYVWGASGQDCTTDKRRYFMNRDVCPAGDKELIRKRCQVLNGTSGSCSGCKYYPGGARTRIQDCQGFMKEIFKTVGITLSGGGATSMYNNNANWTEKGLIAKMPAGAVCLVFKYISSTGKMDHVGLHIGGGNIIHCSGEVKRGKTTDSGWTHYAIPKGMEGGAPMPTERTIRQGDRGDDVKKMQQLLADLGYNIGSSGADGIYGKNTKAAVVAFQKANGLAADGICGPRTWEKLLADQKPEEPAEERYTVTIPNLTEEEAENLCRQWAGAEKTKEQK